MKADARRVKGTCRRWKTCQQKSEGGGGGVPPPPPSSLTCHPAANQSTASGRQAGFGSQQQEAESAKSVSEPLMEDGAEKKILKAGRTGRPV